MYTCLHLPLTIRLLVAVCGKRLCSCDAESMCIPLEHRFSCSLALAITLYQTRRTEVATSLQYKHSNVHRLTFNTAHGDPRRACVQTCMAEAPSRPEYTIAGGAALPGCPFGSACCSVRFVGSADCVDCRCFLSFVFLRVARRLELSPCNTGVKGRSNSVEERQGAVRR